MRLTFLRSLWGVSAPLADAIPTIARRGYAGVEATLFGHDLGELRATVDAHGLRLLGCVYTDGVDPDAHFDSFRRQVDQWIQVGAAQVNAHTARDAWPVARSVEFYGRVVEYERTLPFQVTHETHRGRAFFTPWSTRDICTQVPGVRLCCDLSHWVCVAERLLPDCDAELALAAARCRHLHARVGYEQGPQVPDPAAPRYAAQLAAHERWWRAIVDAQRNLGAAELTVVPEYGPPDYLHTTPATDAPVIDLDAVVEWAAARLRRSLA